MDMVLPELVGDLPNISGNEADISSLLSHRASQKLEEGCQRLDLSTARSAYSIALHMHQPLIPSGGGDLRRAPVVSNLKHMMDHLNVGDNHNAPVFHWCYKRMAEFIPQLVHDGKRPRIMMDYSGCLLYGLRQMGLDDVIAALKVITCDLQYAPCVEWLGSAWGHAVAPSTPVQDYRLHVRAWQHHFAAIFGAAALCRVYGFSPAEMALPNHPDVAYEFVRTLKECGYRWLLVQEHTVEVPGRGGHSHHPHVPHRLVAQNSRGEIASITAIIKTQGSDTKLVGQMQPYYEAKHLSRTRLGQWHIPPLVTQIADGENGGVMMNEFPPKFLEVMSLSSESGTPPVTVSEYLQYLDSLGIVEENLPPLQPVLQKRIWDRFTPGDGPDDMNLVIRDLAKEDRQFHMEGGSWTNSISWVRGYENVLGPMEAASAKFAEKILAANVSTADTTYRKALFYLLCSQTSCYRYWGHGVWTEYGAELCRRAMEIMESQT